MRQAGILAAAGNYALDHNIVRLADDHRRARRLGEALAALPGISVDLDRVVTNMVYVDITDTGRDATAWTEALQAQGVLLAAVSDTEVRVVTHLDVDDQGIERAIEVFAGLAG